MWQTLKGRCIIEVKTFLRVASNTITLTYEADNDSPRTEGMFDGASSDSRGVKTSSTAFLRKLPKNDALIICNSRYYASYLTFALRHVPISTPSQLGLRTHRSDWIKIL